MELEAIHEVILRGLVGSCISACTLKEWWAEHHERLGMVGHWHTDDFEDALEVMRHEGLVEVQRKTTCYVCDRRREDGWSLTEEGYALLR